MDYQALLYSPIYVSLGVTAELVTSAGTSATVTVLDKTTGIDVGTDTIVETIKPACIVRAAELSDNDITRTDLPEGQITFNGNTWRIKSTQPKPSPNGESDGEYILFLLNEG